MSKQIFVTGAVTDWDDPLGWHSEVEEEYDEHTVVNPYDFGDDVDVYAEPQRVMEPAVAAVGESDVVVAHWDDGVNLPGMAVYMYEAFQEDIPITVWYSGDRDVDQVSPTILWLSEKRVYEDMEKAVDVALGMTGDTSRFHFG